MIARTVGLSESGVEKGHHLNHGPRQWHESGSIKFGLVRLDEGNTDIRNGTGAHGNRKARLSLTCSNFQVVSYNKRKNN